MIRKAIIVVLTAAAVTAALAWAVSVRWRYCHYTTQAQITVCGGGVSVIIARRPFGSAFRDLTMPPAGWSRRPVHPGIPTSNIGWPVLRIGPCVYAYAPYWLLIGLTGSYPAIALIRGPLRRYRRCRRGRCITCGYNLKHNVSGVCSECGTKVRQR